MKDNLEYDLYLFNKTKDDLFDENGKRYTATKISDNEAEMMLRIIQGLESIYNNKGGLNETNRIKIS